MRLCAALVLFASFAWAENVQVVSPNSVYGYLKNYGIPRAEEIRKAEEQLTQSRIVGGVPAALGQYPFQVPMTFVTYLMICLFSFYTLSVITSKKALSLVDMDGPQNTETFCIL